KERDLLSRGFCFREAIAGIGFVEEDLPLQIALFNKVAVDQCESADPGPRQQGGRSRSYGSAADQGDMRAGELPLALPANTGIEHLARIPFRDRIHGKHFS